LFTFGEGLEGFSASRARDSLRSLLALQPQTANLLRKSAASRHDHEHDHGHGHDHDHPAHQHTPDEHEHAHDDHAPGQIIVSAESLSPGDVILVRPGERIAADGLVQQGLSNVNQAAVTGESIPVPKAPGDTVMAGTVN